MDKSKEAKPKSTGARKKKAETKTAPGRRLALIRIRGKVHVRSDIADSMKHLRLTEKNNCVIIDDRPEYLGMLQKVKDYITYGEIDAATFRALLGKRGRIEGNKELTDAYVKENMGDSLDAFTEKFIKFETELDQIPKIKKVFKLHPPVGGFERKGIKQPFSTGGVLGYRGDKINELINRML